MPDRIAVIGHGRSPEGRGFGPAIDSCSAVVRMWDWAWQERADYGERYDYGVFTILPVSLKAFREAQPWPPRVSWLAYRRASDGGELPAATEIIDQCYRDRIGGPTVNLTRGCAAACWAIDRAGSGGIVVLVGFDNLKAGQCLPVEEAFPPRYREHYDRIHPQWRRSWYPPNGGARCGSHDIAAERGLIEGLAAERGVTVAFAEDIW
jgi:hypothetical protein